VFRLILCERRATPFKAIRYRINYMQLQARVFSPYRRVIEGYYTGIRYIIIITRECSLSLSRLMVCIVSGDESQRGLGSRKEQTAGFFVSQSSLLMGAVSSCFVPPLSGGV